MVCGLTPFFRVINTPPLQTTMPMRKGKTGGARSMIASGGIRRRNDLRAACCRSILGSGAPTEQPPAGSIWYWNLSCRSFAIGLLGVKIVGGNEDLRD